MTMVDIIWLAGIIEGEGCFSDVYPIIQLQMTDKDVVERVASLFDRPLRAWQSKTTGLKRVYICNVSGTDAISWMMTLYSEMGTRRRGQIKEAINKWKASSRIPRGANGRRLPAICHPDRLRKAHGLCPSCSVKNYRSRGNTMSGDRIRPSDLHLRVNAKIQNTHSIDIARTRPDLGDITPIAKDISWLAGVLEGEGSFLKANRQPVISLAMADRDVIEHAARLWNRAANTWHRKGSTCKGSNYKPIHFCRVTGVAAISWMMTLYSSMGIRRKQRIKSLIEEWRASSNMPKSSRGYRFPAICHSDRVRHGRGLCRACYWKIHGSPKRNTSKRCMNDSTYSNLTNTNDVRQNEVEVTS